MVSEHDLLMKDLESHVYSKTTSYSSSFLTPLSQHSIPPFFIIFIFKWVMTFYSLLNNDSDIFIVF